MSKLLITTLRFFICVSFAFLSAQELPPIKNYRPNVYKAGNQNWKIDQSSNSNMYFANNEGLLEYNGSNWKLYPSPNSTIIRSVRIVNDIIYTGCFMEFGLWKKDVFGNFKYNSLIPLFKGKMVEDEQIWDIIPFEESIIFQSFKNLYVYDLNNKEINKIAINNGIQKIFKINNSLLFQGFNGIIYTVKHGKSQILITDSILKTKKIIKIFNTEKGLLLITDKGETFKYNNKVLSKRKTDFDEMFKNTTIYSAEILKNENLVMGTISKGIIYLDKNGKFIHQFNQINGLSNNTILSLYIDNQENIWAGLDNGIDVINLKSPITIYKDDKGVLGTVYTSIIHNSKIYLGTNQGLFVKKYNSKESFQLIKGSDGQIWNLIKYKNELFCGHNLGIFLVKDNDFELISKVLGTWDIKPIPNLENTLLVGSYSGLFVMKKNENNWFIKNKIKGFEISSRFFEFESSHLLWVNHEYKGVYRIDLNKDYTKIKTVKLDGNLPKGKNSSIVKYKRALYYAYNKGVFKKEKNASVFVYDSILSPIIKGNNYTSGKMIVDRTNKLWFSSTNNITYISNNNLTNSIKVNNIPIQSNLRKGMTGFENISLIKNNNYLIGTSNGYLKIDLSKVNEKKQNLYLNSIQISTKLNKKIFLELNKDIDLKSNQNSLDFNFSIPEFNSFSHKEYQYKLLGKYNEWSSWSESSTISFKNLQPNKYTLMVRAKVNNTITNQINTIFSINKPWYLSNLAIAIYLLIILLILYILNKLYMWYYKKQLKHKELTNEKLIMQIENEKLNIDIDGKNRELAISTMSIIKKNKALSSVKKELLKNTSTPEIKSVIRLIDRNLNNEKDWKFFEQAFNNADKDFLNKVKQVHPKLTPNDLRFCAYLRLNLSSKEIAPLLNISVRSIEIKRYRLRKKMNLEHSTSLVKYILSF